MMSEAAAPVQVPIQETKELEAQQIGESQIATEAVQVRPPETASRSSARQALTSGSIITAAARAARSAWPRSIGKPALPRSAGWILGAIGGLLMLLFIGQRLLPPAAPAKEPGATRATTAPATEAAATRGGSLPVVPPTGIPATSVSPTAAAASTLSVSGEIIDSQGPVVNIPVALEEVLNDEDCGKAKYEATTKDGGQYSFENVAPGNYCLDANYDNTDAEHGEAKTLPGVVGGGPIVKKAGQALSLKPFLIPGKAVHITYPVDGAVLQLRGIGAQWDKYPGAELYVYVSSGGVARFPGVTSATSTAPHVYYGQSTLRFEVVAARKIDPNSFYYVSAYSNSGAEYAAISQKATVNVSRP
jgi:hypothetical protein